MSRPLRKIDFPNYETFVNIDDAYLDFINKISQKNYEISCSDETNQNKR